ncbi:hypothetical protein Ndes2526B_g07329 [Nannochloris sp. 'desiccata']|nr:hypothetical protein NADE_000584 [Chlorella desiccata (nom. nud.)]
MKLLRRHSSKGSSHVDVFLHIEDLGPWPAQHGTLAVQFMRGKRGGQTRPQHPDDENALVASYTFNETLTVPATLYRTSFGENGGYEEKKLSIFIAQVDERGKELSVLGGLELNLADFANIQDKVRQSYPIECSSAIWKPAGGRPKLTMSIAVARAGDKTAADLKAELSGPLFPVDEMPSTLSTDAEDEEESVTTSPEAQGSVSVGWAGGGRIGNKGNALGIKNSSHERGSTSNFVGSAFSGGGVAAAAATAAAITATSSSPVVAPSPAESDNLRYDDEGFVIDSELTGSKQSALRGETAAAASHLNTNNAAPAAEGEAVTAHHGIFQSGDSSAAVVKRNLNKYLDGVNRNEQHDGRHSPLGTAGVASAASGTAMKKDLISSSPGSIHQLSPLQQQPVHVRRFSRGDGTALGSRKWAWRRQSNDPAIGGGAGDGDVTIERIASASSPTTEMHSPYLKSPGDGGIGNGSTSAGASYLSGTSGVASTAGTAGAASAAVKTANAAAIINNGTPDKATALGAYPQMVAGSLSSTPNSLTASLHRELQISAALESAIFLAGHGWATSSSSYHRRQLKAEQLQAPARRLARTIIILGPDEGAAFGQRAVSAIRAAAAASLSDPHRLLLWWANAVTLRWSFWALGRGGGGGGGGDSGVSLVCSEPGSAGRKEYLASPGSQGIHGSWGGGGGGSSTSSHFDWLSRSLSPALRHLEAQMYTDLMTYLWNGVLVPSAVQSAADAAAQKDKINTGNAQLASTAESKPSSIMRTLSSGNSANSRTTGNSNANSSVTAEGAMNHWIRALRAVDAALTPAGRPPAAPRPLLSLLRRHVMTGMLTRVDSALLDMLLYDTDENKGVAGIENLMKPELIPISRCFDTTTTNNNNNKGSRGLTTSFDFISGVELKMAAGRLVEYASELGIREGPAPRIKEIADLLMTPKSSLGEEEVRRTVAPSLQPGTLVKVLQKYQPDDADVSADDKLPVALIKQLRAEAATIGGGSAGKNANRNHDQGVLINEAYVPPVEEVLLEEGIIQPLSLETSAESDDEMSVLEGQGDVRYSLLRDLWGAVRAV